MRRSSPFVDLHNIVPPLLSAAFLLGLAAPIPATTYGPDPGRIAMCPEGDRPGIPIPNMTADMVFRTYDTSPARRAEILTTLSDAGVLVEASPNRRISVPVPFTTVDQAGLCLRVLETAYVHRIEQYNTRPKPDDVWLATVSTEAFGQTWTVTREREPGGGDRVTDNHGGSRFESHDELGRVTRVDDEHGEILYIRYYPGGYRPWIRIDGGLFLKTIYSEKSPGLWEEQQLIGITGRDVYMSWTYYPDERQTFAQLGFSDTVAQWDSAHPEGALLVKYHRGRREPYAFSALDSKDETWRSIALPHQEARILYTDKEIRLTIRGETVTWRRGELPR